MQFINLDDIELLRRETCDYCFAPITEGGMLIDNTAGHYHEECVDRALELALEMQIETEDSPFGSGD